MTPEKHTLNTIAYMVTGYSGAGWKHVGFKELAGAYTNWGIKLNDKWFASCYTTDGPLLLTVSDEFEQEHKYIGDMQYVFPVVLFGNDNTSYVVRFKTERERNLFVTNDDSWDCYSNIIRGFYVNS